jgi:hypothetical protein
MSSLGSADVRRDTIFVTGRHNGQRKRYHAELVPVPEIDKCRLQTDQAGARE